MEGNNSTNGYISQIQVSDSEKYDLNAKYWNDKPFADYKIDGESIYDGGSISIFKKYIVLSSLSEGTKLEPNTKYIFSSDVTSLDFTKNIDWNNADYNYCEYTFIFNSGENALGEALVIFPKDWYWSNGEEPFIEPNIRYELSVSVINTTDNSDNDNNIVHAILVPFVKVNNK